MNAQEGLAMLACRDRDSQHPASFRTDREHVGERPGGAVQPAASTLRSRMMLRVKPSRV